MGTLSPLQVGNRLFRAGFYIGVVGVVARSASDNRAVYYLKAGAVINRVEHDIDLTRAGQRSWFQRKT